MTIEETTREIVTTTTIYQVKCDLCPADLETLDEPPDEGEHNAEVTIVNAGVITEIRDLCGACSMYLADKLREITTPIKRVRTYGSKSGGDE